ncbi:MAG: hypothetical protein K0R39_4931 [Symbiobacteriaceae bacterium]|nr:hypothetical protein [Symbiobacteriaceae bacterium]
MSADELLLLAQLRQAGHEIAIATIIHTRGHTPREVGARMLVLRDGRCFGTIGGGCGEAEVRMRALQVMDEKRPALHVVDLLDDPALEDGAVCGGKMEVWIEPVMDQLPAGA